MAETTGERPVLVAVSSPAHVGQLVRTAGDLARVGDGVVRIVTVVSKSRGSPFSVYADETIVERFSGDSREILERAAAVAPDDVAVEREVVVDRSVTGGLYSAVVSTDASALVIGWEGYRRRSNTVFGTTIDRLLERVPCDLYVERIGHETGTVDSVLVPVAGGPHVRPAVTAARAIAARNAAVVSLLSVIADDVDEARASEFVAEARALAESTPGPEVRVETDLREDEDALAAIVGAARDHDVVILGATRQGALQRRLVGSIARRVVNRTDRTVVLARAGDAVDESILDRVRRRWISSTG